MKTILLSFSADVYNKLLKGNKIFEHRKNFPEGNVKAYLYVSSPVKAITGIITLSNRTNIDGWLTKYQTDVDAVLRIQKYMRNYRYVMQIDTFQQTLVIPLEKLRKDISGFVVPQMYYYLDNSELLEYLEEKLDIIGDLVANDFNNIESTQICPD